ncbi:hypothetical protein SAT01_12200 [Sinomonas atrocyanea]|nr:hypothetical protein [Sinomonas atrocyanea]GEB63772.1 hypothetical protein SAT01_12200 [Sinomonas atrocyanea]GGG74440.1 hypothetical protein GCM10007172_28970 [Sinomonas atrocyanea]
MDDALELPVPLGVSVVVNAHPDLVLFQRIRDGEPIATVPREDFRDALDLDPRSSQPSGSTSPQASRGPLPVRSHARRVLRL